MTLSMLLTDASRTKKIAIALALAMGVGVIGAGNADARKIPQSVKNACSKDYTRFCPRYRVGSKKLDKCVEAKFKRISCRCVYAMVNKGLVPYKSLRKRRSC